MTAWIAVLIPLLIMVFALGMERLETRLRAGTVREDEVEDFLERARPDEVKALFRQGIGGALQMFRLRNLGKRGGGSKRGRGTAPTPRDSTSV
ncbi:hypothetical protein [Actinomycetospora sp.]|jgi:hypothetical protein|uniref:hypothetical protein n=1 Tax=Actinomycetospora sp. TaxID=1872135 RepID=UPI002F3FE0E9